MKKTASVRPSTTNVLDDNFHLVAGTLDGQDLKIYVDGVLEGSIAFTGTPAGNTRDVLIGKHFTLGRFFGGLVDEVEIYDRALTDTEIQAIFKAGKKGNKPKKQVTICHKPDTPAQKTLVIPYHALAGHLGHGDTVGALVISTTLQKKPDRSKN